MKTPILETSLAAAFAAVGLIHRTVDKPFFTEQEELALLRRPPPINAFQRRYYREEHPDQESYLIFEDHSIYVAFGFGLPAAPHTLSSLAAAVEARRKDGLPLPPALRDLLIHIVSDEQGGWEEAEVDTALLLLAAADRDARLKAVWRQPGL